MRFHGAKIRKNVTQSKKQRTKCVFLPLFFLVISIICVKTVCFSFSAQGVGDFTFPSCMPSG